MAGLSGSRAGCIQFPPSIGMLEIDQGNANARVKNVEPGLDHDRAIIRRTPTARMSVRTCLTYPRHSSFEARSPASRGRSLTALDLDRSDLHPVALDGLLGLLQRTADRAGDDLHLGDQLVEHRER